MFLTLDWDLLRKILPKSKKCIQDCVQDGRAREQPKLKMRKMVAVGIVGGKLQAHCHCRFAISLLPNMCQVSERVLREIFGFSFLSCEKERYECKTRQGLGLIFSRANIRIQRGLESARTQYGL